LGLKVGFGEILRDGYYIYFGFGIPDG